MEIPFKHDPLEHPWQIRVLEMLPGEGSNPIHCKVRLIPGGDARDIDPNYDEAEDKKKIPYHALSYTWGKAIESHIIWLEDKPFPIRANLYEFLKQCRPKEDSFFLWIDAICINQKDKDEKTLQVRRMRDIYKCAGQVLVCLGEAPGIGAAMQLVYELNFIMNTYGKIYLGQHVATFYRRRQYDKYLRVRVEALLDLLSHPWFERIWVSSHFRSCMLEIYSRPQ